MQLEKIVLLPEPQERQTRRGRRGGFKIAASAQLALTAQTHGGIAEQVECFTDIAGIQIGGEPGQTFATQSGRIFAPIRCPVRAHTGAAVPLFQICWPAVHWNANTGIVA